METQDWEGKELDKDVLVAGNKLYSPDTCAFITRKTNSFFIKFSSCRLSNMTGSTKFYKNGYFRGQCSNPITNKQEKLGKFKTKEEAHLAWRKRKQEIALLLISYESDPRIVDALKNIFKEE